MSNEDEEQPAVVRSFGQEIAYGLSQLLQAVGIVIVILAIGAACGNIKVPW